MLREVKGQLLGQKASQVNKTQTICLTASSFPTPTLCAYACVHVCEFLVHSQLPFSGSFSERVCCSRALSTNLTVTSYNIVTATHTHTHTHTLSQLVAYVNVNKLRVSLCVCVEHVMV